ncbi:hypothetical protein ACJRO7_035849 [Eucalyptus globulus]|uniref:Uncharacterized protein n=1 Tax=Eucalyptus globulus TaxID=34317 RepID=A0ABD3JBI5_EUCGL
MEAGILHSLAPSPNSPPPSVFSLTTSSTAAAAASPPLLLLRRRRRLAAVTASATGGSRDDERSAPAPPVTPSDKVEIRFRRGSRRRRQQSEDGAGRVAATAATERAPPTPKSWEEMSLVEKALELYVGEKGLLFWLNKFAYASIFVVIGAWILFRFVGPSLNLYQLDTPPLAPTSILKG